MSELQVAGLVAGYGRIEALHGVDLAVAAGEAVTIVGANGAGKTTLLKTIAGLIRPTGGRLLWDGQDVTGWSAEKRVKAGLVLVPEGRRVFAGLSVADNLVLGGYVRRGSPDFDEVYSLFPVLAERRSQPAGTLSGGEQQMLAIGRALMSRPRLVLLDEPSLGLAPLMVAQVTAALVELRTRGVPLLLVEQNATAAFKVAERGYLLDRGSVAAAGTTAELAADSRVQAAYLGPRS
ncbi:MAG TPA: ABC transporter ATP-binding protein [Micromonosporaceae bacterium]|nr:ABC transporter ATP-binding protein [Micromonosporaceae bacterium]